MILWLCFGFEALSLKVSILKSNSKSCMKFKVSSSTLFKQRLLSTYSNIFFSKEIVFNVNILLQRQSQAYTTVPSLARPSKHISLLVKNVTFTLAEWLVHGGTLNDSDCHFLNSKIAWNHSFWIIHCILF